MSIRASVRILLAGGVAAAMGLAGPLPDAALAEPGAKQMLDPAAFTDGDGDGRPDGWFLQSGGGQGQFKLVSRAGETALQITADGSDKTPMAISGGWEPADMIRVEPQTPLHLTVRARAADAGASAIASVAIQYRTESNQWLASESSGPIDLKRPWRALEVRSLVPSGAAYAQVLLQAREGRVQFSRVGLTQRDWLGDIEPADDKLFFINMDYNDMVVMPEALGVTTYREPEIAAFFERCAEMGVDGVLWRVSIFGQVAYQSRVRTVFPGRTDPQTLKPVHRDLADILESMDPLAVAIREARKHGIQVYIWVTLSDEVGVSKDDPTRHSSDFILDNPHYALLSRDGEPMRGTLCYNEPAVREHRLDQIRELVDYGADGIYLCTRTHAFYHNTDEGMDYGYNPPIVETYQERYGVNILEEPFDKQKWLEIRAEGLSAFIEEAAEIIHAADQKLWLGVKSTRHEDRGWPYGDALLPWKSWLGAGWLDGLVAGHYYTPIGQIPAVAEAFDDLAHDDQTLLLWQQCWHYQEKRFTPIEDLVRQVQMIATTSIDGTTYHEAHNLESQPPEAYWRPLADAIADYWPESAPRQ